MSVIPDIIPHKVYQVYCAIPSGLRQRLLAGTSQGQLGDSSLPSEHFIYISLFLLVTCHIIAPILPGLYWVPVITWVCYGT